MTVALSWRPFFSARLGEAAAELKGHYVPGFTGLQNGSQGPLVKAP